MSANTVEIKLCYEDTTVYPWITGQEEGLVFTELKIVEKKLKAKITYLRLPWKRCQLEAAAGNLDGLIAASFNRERTAWGVYPTNKDGSLNQELRLHTDSFYIYSRKDSEISFNNSKFMNLGNNPIGAQIGYSVGNDLKDQGLLVHIAFTSAYDLLKQLNLSSLNVAVLQNYEAARTIRENPHFKKNIIRSAQPYIVKDQYLLVTKKFYQENQKLTHELWNEISTARKSPEYESMLQKLLPNY